LTASLSLLEKEEKEAKTESMYLKKACKDRTELLFKMQNKKDQKPLKLLQNKRKLD